MEEVDNDALAMITLGIDALKRIDLTAAPQTGRYICHHFSPYAVDATNEEMLTRDDLRGLAAALASSHPTFDIDLIGGSFGIECWEDGAPTLEWVKARIPQMCTIAQAAGVHYDGWSWEPPGRQPVAATQSVEVFRVTRGG